MLLNNLQDAYKARKWKWKRVEIKVRSEKVRVSKTQQICFIVAALIYAAAKDYFRCALYGEIKNELQRPNCPTPAQAFSNSYLHTSDLVNAIPSPIMTIVRHNFIGRETMKHRVPILVAK